MPSLKIKQHDFKPKVLGQEISRILAESILEDVLKGGDRLVEADLQKQFGISRSPLREAFRDLEKKGLVVIIPRKGTFVRRITDTDIKENFPVRAALEALAAKEAYQRISSKELAAMEHALLNMKKAVISSDTKTYWKYHIQFHNTFINASENSVLINILKTLRMHGMWYRFSYQYYQEDLNKSFKIHSRIYSLFLEKNTDTRELMDIVQSHIEIALEKFLAYLQNQAESHDG